MSYKIYVQFTLQDVFQIFFSPTVFCRILKLIVAHECKSLPTPDLNANVKAMQLHDLCVPFPRQQPQQSRDKCIYASARQPRPPALRLQPGGGTRWLGYHWMGQGDFLHSCLQPPPPPPTTPSFWLGIVSNLSWHPMQLAPG